jgi:flagellar hook assembly protein FlgD
VLYQNFPNPFPTPASPTTCLWFDLAAPGDVTLAVYDLRGRLVRTIIPSAQIGRSMSAGAYGRLTPGTNSGCDPRFAWDGRASDGRSVPPGVYLARLHADGRWQTKKMVFRGP